MTASSFNQVMFSLKEHGVQTKAKYANLYLLTGGPFCICRLKKENIWRNNTRLLTFFELKKKKQRSQKQIIFHNAQSTLEAQCPRLRSSLLTKEQMDPMENREAGVVRWVTLGSSKRSLVKKTPQKQSCTTKQQRQQALSKPHIPTGASWFKPPGIPSADFHSRQEWLNDYPFWHLHWRTSLFFS